jgi:hypothetical protein
LRTTVLHSSGQPCYIPEDNRATFWNALSGFELWI